jgi:hypothetical protein
VVIIKDDARCRVLGGRPSLEPPPGDDDQQRTLRAASADVYDVTGVPIMTGRSEQQSARRESAAAAA